MTDPELRAAYGEARASGAAGRGPCPAPESLRDVVARNGPEEARLRTLDHAMACPSCAEDLEILRQVAGLPPRPRVLPKLAPVALAASVVLLAGSGLGIWGVLSRDDVPPTYRATDGEITLVTPTYGSPQADVRFVWSSVGEGASYRFEIFDASGTAVFFTTTQDTALTLPQGVIKDAGEELRWWVQARLRDGSERTSRAEILPPGVESR